MEHLVFSTKNPFEEILENNSKILNFLNLESLWQFNNNLFYKKSISKKNNNNFPDGRLIGIKLRISQKRGPTFIKLFLKSNIAKKKKHFFLGNGDISNISKITKISKSNLKVYNPPYIKNNEFSSKERKNIILKLKKFKPDYIWVCIGSPKQEILSNQLFKEYPKIYVNIGAALDFLVGNKSEAHPFWRALGLEWFYRGITDFKHSKTKIWRSFMALRYLDSIKKEE